MREQRIALEHHAEIALLGRQGGDVPPVEQHARPVLGATKPAMMFSSVVLPEADGPSSVQEAAGFHRRIHPCTAMASP